jgi:hypothetical protein
VNVEYVDVDSDDIDRYPSVVDALKEGASVPLVLVGDTVKTPAVLSFSWIVNEFRGLGVLE